MIKRKYRISPTTGLSLFKECPKCFWLHYNKKISRPRGIFPSLPGGMDEVIKLYFDGYRGSPSGLPPELRGQIEGRLVPDQKLLDQWRNWRTGLSWQTVIRHGSVSAEVTLFGALDDCLLAERKLGRSRQQVYLPLDYKTRGSAPLAGDSERYYQTQLDSYATLLEHNGFEVGQSGYLVYYYPALVKPNGLVRFEVEAVRVAVSVQRLERLLSQAVTVLLGPLPAEHSACVFNDWHRLIREFD